MTGRVRSAAAREDNLSAFFNFSLRWQDLIDIVIVAFISYRVLLFFVDTRAMQLVRGLFVIVLLGIMARSLELRTITWLLSRLLSAVIIAIPVVFQPELRRLLEEIGRSGLLSGRKSVDDIADSYSEALTNAISYLQKHRIGALVIFQRDTGLKEIWRSAVQIRAEITQELILSIFWPNNPLHDGAVIIDRQSIIAASCYLPLTDNDDISRWHGTRHRAAVGVTEVSDAQALVVSEEQGHVSLAVRGRLSKPLTEDQVSRFVRRYFNPHGGGGILRRLKNELKPQWPGDDR
ncbi:MAG: diadenylate cyclase CdaA [Synergistaceae bacterium]|nr:diadenylate cyclase CdaA [Synergistaceae bacterium]